jgi:hypothetical protein
MRDPAIAAFEDPRITVGGALVMPHGAPGGMAPATDVPGAGHARSREHRGATTQAASPGTRTAR